MSTLINEKVAYTVWKSGSDYFAQNGHTNTVDFKGTVAHTVINSAITGAAVNGGIVLVKGGTYTLTSAVVMKDHVTLMGEGVGSTAKPYGTVFTSANPAIHLVTATSVQYWKIKDIYFKHATAAGAGCAIYITTSNFFSILGNMIMNVPVSGYGIYITGSGGAGHIGDNWIWGSSVTGIYISSSSSDLLIERNLICGWTYNIEFGGERNTIVGNYLGDVGSGGAMVKAGYGWGCIIADNQINDAQGTSHGILSDGADHLAITGNSINNSGGDGIHLTSSNYTTITGNSIRGSGSDGIELTTACSNVVISGNIITENTGFGVNEAGTTNYTLLGDNGLIGNGTTHNVDAANSIIGHNLV